MHPDKGHCEFFVMQFGLSSAPSIFQAMMNQLSRPYLWKFVIVFLDDILICSSAIDSHLQQLPSPFPFKRSPIFFKVFPNA